MTSSDAARVLVVDDEVHIREAITQALGRAGYSVDTASDADAALAKLEHLPFDVALCDIRLPGTSGMELLARIRELYGIDVIIITGYSSVESAVTAIKSGAADYLAKPFTPEQVRHVVAKTLAQRRLAEENDYLSERLRLLAGEEIVVGESAPMRRLFTLARTAAASDSCVLVSGESGSGKEVVARFIHGASPRKDGSFVTVNCAAIPANLLESNLFGHRRGAFTGAVYSRRGSFELANGGTLFLDEIGDMAIEMQAKILRALEERQIWRVGAEEPTTVNVRILAATNKVLENEVRAQRFREDLYWRLNVVQLVVPPLREHPEDIVPLAHAFLKLHARAVTKNTPGFSDEALVALTRYSWPGNVRELRNAIERAVIFAKPGEPIRLGDLSLNLGHPSRPEPIGPANSFRSLREMQLEYMQNVLQACDGSYARAAEILRVSRVTLWRKLGRSPETDDVSE